MSSSLNFDLSAASAASAAEAQAKAELAAKPIRRKRKEPPNDTNGGGGNAAASSSPTVPSLPSGPLPLESSLHLVMPALQSALQEELLSIFYPNTKTHGPHLYRQLPGPQPASIVRKDLATLTQNEYWACEKSDGERAMIYVSKERQSTYMIDRKFLIKQIKHPMYVELFGQQGDSLMDGEVMIHEEGLTTSGPQATFMIFDLLLLNGKRFIESKLSERLAMIGQGVIQPYRQRFPQYRSYPPNKPLTLSLEGSLNDGSDHPLAIRAKRFLRKHHLEEIIKFIKPSIHVENEYIYDDGDRRNKNDGIIFTPENEGYMCRNVQLLKWKWPGLNTIDFLCRSPWFDSDGKLMLYSTASELSDYHNDRPNSKSTTVTIHVRSTPLSSEKRRWFLEHVQGKTHAIAEMQYDLKTSSWIPKLFRWDKSSPNFMTTVMGTLETVIDNVLPIDLYKACNKPGQQPSQAALAAAAASSGSSSSSYSSSSRGAPPHPTPVAPSQSHLWSSGSAAPPSNSSSSSSSNHSRMNPPSSSSSLSSLPPPSFLNFDAAPAPLIASRASAVFEQIAAAEETPIVPTTRLFGD